MQIGDLPKIPGARHRKKRVGRGIGSGHGKTSTRGQKGQRSRTGSGKRPGFEGGRTPLIRLLPKRGFRRKERRRVVVKELVNVGQLNRFEAGTQVTPQRLREAGLIRHLERPIKLLGDGALTRPVRITVHEVSEAARAQVVGAGGTVDLIQKGVNG